MNLARIDALLNLVPEGKLPVLLRGLDLFQIRPDEADEWRRRILARRAFLHLPDESDPVA